MTHHDDPTTSDLRAQLNRDRDRRNQPRTTPPPALRHPDLPDIATTLRAIRSDAEALRAGTTLTRTVPAGRIIARVDQLLQALGEPAGENPAPADPDLRANLGAAIIRALDLSLDTTDPAQRAQIGDWIAQARAAQATGDPEQIRRLLAAPYATDPAAGWNDPLPGGAR